MSKFIDRIKTELTGQRKGLIEPLTAACKAVPKIQPFAYLDVYKFYVEWKVQGACEPKDLPMFLESAIRQLRADIYGDLKHRLYDLERAIYAQDQETVMMVLRDILREIDG